MFENLKKSIIRDFEENTEEKKEANTQGDGNKSMETILLLILIVLIIGVLIGGFYVWNSYQEQQQIIKKQEQAIKEYERKEELTEKQYQACLEKCRLSSMGFDPMFKICEAECKETYGK